MRFRFFDFTVDSDVDFPELEAGTGSAPALWLRHDDAPHAQSGARWFHTIQSDDAEPWLSIGRGAGGYVLRFHERLSVRYCAPHVLWSRVAGISDESLRHLLLDQALPLVAAQEGHTVLHGACALIDGCAVLFAGPAGSGKSTLVASLLANGWRAAADDAAAVAATGDGVFVQPSYAGLRLWPDSSTALNYAAGDAVAEYSDKRRFGGATLPEGAIPLRSVYVLRAGAEHEPPGLQDLSMREAVMALVRNAYVLDIEDRHRAEAQLDALSAIAARLRVRELVVPHRFDALGDVAALVERELGAGVSR